MWPLLGFSVLAIALIVERLRFVSVNKRQRRVVRDVLNLYRVNNVVAALDKLKQNADLHNRSHFFGSFRTGGTQSRKFRLALESEAQAETIAQAL